MRDAKSKVWYSVDVVTPSYTQEAIEYGFIEAGALGTETVDVAGERVRVSGYFKQAPERLQLRSALLDSLRIYNFDQSLLPDLHFEQVEDRDWLEEWKKDWQPVEIGAKIIVAPPWTDLGKTGKIVIRIEPGMAFGTGTHETTRLCLHAIERHFDGQSFLDVGTGTGILAIAAALLHPDAIIEACDIDAEAVEIAKENARLNGVGGRINFTAGTIGSLTASASLVCANLTADVIDTMLPALVDLSCKRLVLSGVLLAQEDGVISRLRELGIPYPLEVSRDGEWVAVIV